MGFAPKAIYNRLYYGLYWRNGEVCAGATFGDRRVDELAVFLGQTCDFSGRSWIAPLTERGKESQLPHSVAVKLSRAATEKELQSEFF